MQPERRQLTLHAISKGSQPDTAPSAPLTVPRLSQHLARLIASIFLLPSGLYRRSR